MERKVTVSLSFDFYPDGEHEDLFDENETIDEIMEACKRMTTEDIYTLSDNGDILRQLSVEVTEE
jgi:hypothetical protein